MKKIQVSLLLAVSALSLVSIGCGSSMRHVRHGASGGEIAFEGALVPGMSAAHLAMVEHCGGRFRIVDDAEAASLAMLAADPSKAEEAASESIAVSGTTVHYVCESHARRTASRGAL